MTCQSIMNPDPPCLREQDTVAKAVDLLLEKRLLAMPVIDGNRIYKGLFAKSRLFGLLLPGIVAIEQMLPKIAHLPDINFLPDYLPEMQDRFRAIADHPVINYADLHVPVVHPDSPVVAAVLVVFRTRNFVPVIEPGTGTLVGMISSWDTIAKIREAR
jgi:CBS-domain-containing membrane protein